MIDLGLGLFLAKLGLILGLVSGDLVNITQNSLRNYARFPFHYILSIAYCENLLCN